jgi:hypothetical protein
MQTQSENVQGIASSTVMTGIGKQFIATANKGSCALLTHALAKTGAMGLWTKSAETAVAGSQCPTSASGHWLFP